MRRNSKNGKLKEASRELAEVPDGDVTGAGSQAVAVSNNSRVNSSSLFLAGTVVCGGSISSSDIANCNNKYWILQGKTVA